MPALDERKLQVTIVGESAKTVESLQRYLSSVGVDSSVMRRLPDGAAVPNIGDAVVIFPDDFESAAVRVCVAHMQRLRPAVRLLLVTSAPQRFQELRANDTQPPIMLAKPAFGWSILDAIRAATSNREESV